MTQDRDGTADVAKTLPRPSKADLPPDVLALVDEPLDAEREALVKAWLRGEGPDPWTVCD